MADILTCTVNPTIDTSTSVDHVAPEHKLRCGRPSHEPGGGGINVSRVLLRMGLESTALFTAGGTMGEWLNRLLAGEGVSTIPCPVRGSTRENFTVLEKASSQQYRFGMPGPKLSPAEWEGVLQAAASLDPPPRYLVASGSLPPGVPVSFYARMSETVRGRGTRVILDTSGEPLKAAVEAGVYLLKPNMRELQQLAGRSSDDSEGLEGIARELLDKYPCTAVAVSLGAGGALLVTGGKSLRISAPTVNIQSKVGAGDSMVAGITAGLARHWSLEEAMRYGVAAGTAAVMTPGTELCRRRDVERLYRVMTGRGSDSPSG
ncbi:MAG: 1-phosphofructokinase family hexose kinase [Spirochaetota bacterium]